MIDLTKITTPFGLLDAETKKALQKHPGPIEGWTPTGWLECRAPAWVGIGTYRARPEPPKPREAWEFRNSVGPVSTSYTKEEADAFSSKHPNLECIHFREVLP